MYPAFSLRSFLTIPKHKPEALRFAIRAVAIGYASKSKVSVCICESAAKGSPISVVDGHDMKLDYQCASNGDLAVRTVMLAKVYLYDI